MVVTITTSQFFKIILSDYNSFNLLNGQSVGSSISHGSVILQGAAGAIWTDPNKDGILYNNVNALTGTIDYTTGIFTGPSLPLQNANFWVISNTSNNDAPNTYQAGQDVKLNVPPSYGMTQANGLIATILAIIGSDFYLDINSNSFDLFHLPRSRQPATNPASLSSAGSQNLQFNNGTYQVPTQNLNNIGN
jgi:hypothetical protein